MALTTLPPGNPTPPNELTEETQGNPAIPNELTEQGATSPAVPNELTELSPGSPAVPVDIPELPTPAFGVPTDLTELGAGSPAVPNNLTELSAGTIAVPNELTELAEGVIRTFDPLLELDFANDAYATNAQPQDLNDLVTYSRNSTASFWNRRLNTNGKWETFLDTDYVGSVTNLVLQSEDYIQSEWTKQRSTATGGITDTPFGTGTATRLTEDTTLANDHKFTQNLTWVSGTTYNHSVYIKPETRRAVRITFGNNSFPTNSYADFYFDTQTSFEAAGMNESKIAYVGNGWYQISISSTADASTTANVEIILLNDSNVASYDGDGVSSVLVWGSQVTASEKALPYVPTTTTSASDTFTETPRLEYDPVTAEPLGYLAEGASTNLLRDSETIENWDIDDGSVTSNEVIAPDGTKSADQFIENSANALHRFKLGGLTITASETLTASIYAKADGSGRQFTITFFQSGGAIDGFARFNLETGVIEATGGTDYDSSTITDVGNGWYRCTTTSTASGSGAGGTVLYTLHNGTTSNYLGDGTSGIYAWGGQCEALPFASSYIRTEGSTVTRSEDEMSGSIAVDQSLTIRGVARVLGILNSANQYVLSVGVDTNNSNNILAQSTNARLRPFGNIGGVTQYDLSNPNYIFSDGFVDAVIALENDNVITYGNGSASLSDTDATISESTLFVVGGNMSNNNPIYGHTKIIAVYDEVLTATEVSNIDGLSVIQEIQGAISAPTELTELSAGALSVPNELTELSVPAFPRNFAPTLNLNFRNDTYGTFDNPKALDDIVTYSRNSAASFWNRRLDRRGKWETFIDYDVVGSITNELTYSNNLLPANGDWTDDGGATTTAEPNETHPLGSGINVVKVTSNTNNFCNLKQDVTLSGIVTLSFDVKKVDNPYCVIRLAGTGIGAAVATSTSYSFYFDERRFVHTSGDDDSMVSSEYLGDDWWRIHLTNTSATTITAATVYPAWNEGIVRSVLVARAQLTTTFKPSPFIETQDTTVTEVFTEQPRLEYDPVTAQPKGYLSERTSTNLLFYSEDFSNGWTLGNATITINSGAGRLICPDGTNSQDVLDEDSAASSTHFIRQNQTVTASTVYTFSVFVRQREREYIRLQNSGDSNSYMGFDLVNGTTLPSAGAGFVDGGIQDCGGGWFRCWIAFDTETNTTASCRIYLLDGNQNVTYNGDGFSGVRIWGAQLETGYWPTSYIRTGGAASVQRVRDQMSLEITNYPDASIKCTFDPIQGANPTGGTGAFRNIYYRDTVGNGEEYINIRSNGDISVKRGDIAYTVANTGTWNGETEIVYVMDQNANTLAGYVDKGAITPITNNDTEYDSTSILWLGNQNGSVNESDCYILDFVYYGDSKLTQDEINQL